MGRSVTVSQLSWTPGHLASATSGRRRFACHAVIEPLRVLADLVRHRGGSSVLRHRFSCRNACSESCLPHWIVLVRRMFLSSCHSYPIIPPVYPWPLYPVRVLASLCVLTLPTRPLPPASPGQTRTCVCANIAPTRPLAPPRLPRTAVYLHRTLVCANIAPTRPLAPPPPSPDRLAALCVLTLVRFAPLPPQASP